MKPIKSIEVEQLADETNISNETNVADLTPQALQALRWFYDRLSLSDSDRKSLFTERGLNDATIELLGFRSNPQSYKGLLLEMANHFPLAVLVESGLWKADADKAGETPKPNPQFYGMAIVEKRDAKGKKVRDTKGEVIRECVWTNPILIPYFNEAGELVHLRPHKGMMAGKTPRLYVVRSKGQSVSPKSTNDKTKIAIITEGEFKAAALWQSLGDIAEIAALPGITMAKPLMGDVEEWLEINGVRQVVVGYDNEEKGDERLPSYQREKYRRYDTQIWARYLARQLSRQGYEGKVCVLPDEWRDKNGKADWDGCLAAFVSQLGAADGSQSDWEKIRDQVRAKYLPVIHGAIYIGEFRHVNIFDHEVERIIQSQLDKISYEPCLPIGGEEEQALARRLHRLAARLRPKEWFPYRAVRFLSLLARLYQATDGRYYKMNPLTEKAEEFWQELQKTVRERGEEDAKRVCDLVLRGRKSLKAMKRGHIPETISDFYFKPQYVLHRSDGTHTRIVIIHNVHGVITPKLEMSWDDFGSPVKLRDWVHKSLTGSAWDGGQSELTALHEDLAHALAFKDVVEVPVRGYHAKSKIWFFEDLAISADGEVTPDPKTGIFWIRNDGGLQGYTFAKDSDGRPRDREDEVFRQGAPHMHPEIKDSVKDVTALFEEVLQKLPEALGGMEAYMALGMVFASAAGPEIFGKWSCFPGLWVFGEQGGGKSALCRWLIRIWGFNKDHGLPLPADDQRTTLTQAALSGALGQYGELSLWLDEYQTGTPSWVRAILKNNYDRAEGAKKNFGSSPREFLSSVIVCGVATSSEPQTRSRYAHIQVSAKRRTANHYEWFQTHSLEFYRLGRFLLRNRKQYTESVLAAMQTWIKSPALQNVDDRTRMVHAMAYAGLHAACELFEVSADLKGYWDWLIDYCKRSAAEIQKSVSVDHFWYELLNALDSDAFGRTPAERRQFFQAIEDKKTMSPVSEHQTKAGAAESYKAWKSYLLYFRPGPVIELLRASKRRSGGDLPISQSDLLSQMKTRPYWHESKNESGHRQRFGGKSTQSCWCIKVDLHPLGLMLVSDEKFDDSLIQDAEQNSSYTADNWSDPRKGDLHALIESLQNKRDGEGD
ncbi:MAG: hypothetical protein WCH99_16040 [Verrucomicrobiota bacterium]